MSRYKKITNDQWEGLQFELSELKSQMTQVMDILGIEATEVLEELEIDPPNPSRPGFREGKPPKKPRSGLGVGPRNLAEIASVINYAFVLDDWGMDTKWQDRNLQMVTPAGAPDGLELGPFVLTTPEERALILKNWDKKKRELENAKKDRLESSKYLLIELDQAKRSARQWEETANVYATNDADRQADLDEERQKYKDLLLDLRDADNNIEQLVGELERLQQSFERKSSALMQAQGEIAFLKSQPRRSQPPPESGVADWSRMVEEGPE